MDDPSRPIFEITDTGVRVAGTGLERTRAAARAGAARQPSRRGFMCSRPGGQGRSQRGSLDPYTKEDGPGRVSALKRLRADMWEYGAGKTKDSFGTEADVRAISGRAQDLSGFKLRVLTQNLWALPVVSQCLEARVHAFAATLGRGWDVVALQEVWHAREQDALRSAALSAGLRYSRYFQQGCGAPIDGPGSGGTGLLVLSRFPIVETLFWRFSANGQPYMLQHCDYLGGKGVGLARLLTPAGPVDLYISHLHANYGRLKESPEGLKDRYKAHRVAQAFEVANLIRLTSKSPLVLLMTDLNAGPGSMPYGLQRSVAGLDDAFARANPSQAGYTCEASDNVFTNGRERPERIDYVLFRAASPDISAPDATEPIWELKDCWIYRAYVPESDAEGLMPRAAAASAVSTSRAMLSTETAPTDRARDAASPTGVRRRNAGRSPSPPPPAMAVASIGARTHAEASSARSAGGNFIDGVSGGVARGRGAGRSARDSSLGQATPLAAPLPAPMPVWINISDHHGVAAEFTARLPAAEDDAIELDGAEESTHSLSLQHSESGLGGVFPQGPLLAMALREIDRGIEEATRRRTGHLRVAKATAVLWLFLAGGSAGLAWQGALGCFVRAAAAMTGALLSAAASALLLLYWFSAKDEVQGLREVFQTATNYERQLPMEEAFPDVGFDTSQFHRYMEQHFR